MSERRARRGGGGGRGGGGAWIAHDSDIGSGFPGRCLACRLLSAKMARWTRRLPMASSQSGSIVAGPLLRPCDTCKIPLPSHHHRVGTGRPGRFITSWNASDCHVGEWASWRGDHSLPKLSAESHLNTHSSDALHLSATPGSMYAYGGFTNFAKIVNFTPAFRGRDARVDLEQGSADGTGAEEETFSIYGKPASLYGNDASSLYTDDSGSIYPDALLGSELLLNLKESRLSRFLWVRKVLVLAVIFSVSFSMIFALFHSLPKIHAAEVLPEGRFGFETDVGGQSGHRLLLLFPKNLEQLKVMRGTLEVYQKEHRRQLQAGIIGLYLFLQTFMIPGSIFINILAGSLYGFYEALFLVLVLAGTGSSFCYFLSNYILKEIVYHYFPERCEWLAREVHRHRHHLLNYMLFLRLTPFLPNWFINVSSPLVGVPYRDFVVGTTVGLMPASIVGVKAGGILSKINSLRELYDFWTILTMSLIAILVMLPVVIKSRCDRIRGPTLIKTI